MVSAVAETRSFEHVEIRALKAGVKLIGYAAVFNTLSHDLIGFREKIEPGAFAESIKKDDIRALFNHDSGQVLGRSTAGTLRLSEDSWGLAFEIDLDDTQLGSDLLRSVGRGDISDMSFKFRTKEDQWEHLDNTSVRTLLKVQLFDVSPVTFPAYPRTDVSVRWSRAPSADELRLRQRLAEAKEAAPAPRYRRSSKEYIPSAEMLRLRQRQAEAEGAGGRAPRVPTTATLLLRQRQAEAEGGILSGRRRR